MTSDTDEMIRLVFALEMKGDLKIAIEEQQEMGLEGLEEGINLDDLETTSGKDQAYWLLSVKAALASFRQSSAFLMHRQRAKAALRRSHHSRG
mmetsp:Transcript_17323/g.24542  ORF Transcript_17323/g.24542 Transcript_17323/m.24542 type:complete len:93 (+) Transcript_17323:280-558(+)